MLLKKEETKEKKKVYSHSKLWLYENCPEAYKIKYIDKKFPDLPKSIEAFLGSMVHDALEWLYRQKNEGKKVLLDDVIRFYGEQWHNTFTEELRVKEGNNPEDYANKGIKFLINYFLKNYHQF